MTTPQQMQSQVLDQASQLVTTMTETWAGAARAGGSHGDALPGPSEFVDRFFDFWVQLLEAQRGLVLSGIHALLPSVSAPVQMARPTPSEAHVITDGAPSGSVVTPAPSSTTAPRAADSTADEHIGGAAADAIATAAAITAEKTATVTTTPVETTATATKTSTAKKTSPRSTSAAKKTSTAKKKQS